eukprot:c22733_g1_i1 orf=530-1165(+)
MNSRGTSLASSSFVQMVKSKSHNVKGHFKSSSNAYLAKSTGLLAAIRNHYGNCGFGTSVDGASSLPSPKPLYTKNRQDHTVHSFAKSSHDDNHDKTEEKHKKTPSPSEETNTGKKLSISRRSTCQTLKDLTHRLLLHGRYYLNRVSSRLLPETKHETEPKHSGKPTNLSPISGKMPVTDQKRGSGSKMAGPDPPPQRPGLGDLSGQPGQTG